MRVNRAIIGGPKRVAPLLNRLHLLYVRNLPDLQSIPELMALSFMFRRKWHPVEAAFVAIDHVTIDLNPLE